MNKKDWKRHEKRKARKVASVNRQRGAQEQGDATMHVHILPKDSSVEEVAGAFLELCAPDGHMLVVIHTDRGTGMRIVTPEERHRLEREEPQMKGKVMVRMPEERARMLNIL